MNKNTIVLAGVLAALLVGIMVVSNLTDALHSGTGGGVGASRP